MRQPRRLELVWMVAALLAAALWGSGQGVAAQGLGRELLLDSGANAGAPVVPLGAANTAENGAGVADAEPQQPVPPPVAPSATSATPAAKAGADTTTLHADGRIHKRILDSERDLERSVLSPAALAELDALEDELPLARAELAREIERARELLRDAQRSFEVGDVSFYFEETNQRLTKWSRVVERMLTQVRAGRARIAKVLEFWRRAEQLSKEAHDPRTVQQLTADIIRSIQAADWKAAQQEASVERLQLLVQEMQEMTRSIGEYAALEGPLLFEDWNSVDFPLWEATGVRKELARLPEGVWQTLRPLFTTTLQFLRVERARVVLSGVLFVLLLLGLIAVRREGRDLELEQAKLGRACLNHSAPCALLLIAVFGSWLFPSLPFAVVMVTLTAGFAPAVWLLSRVLKLHFRRGLYSMAGLLAVDLVRIALTELPHTERICMVVEITWALTLLIDALRSRRVENTLNRRRWKTLFSVVTRVWIALLFVALVAAILGFGFVGSILGSGVFISAYLAVILGATYFVLSGIVWVLVESRWAQDINAVRQHRTLVATRVQTLVRWCSLLGWLWYTLAVFTLGDLTLSGLKALLAVSFSLGALSVSVGAVVTVVGGVVLITVGARFVRFLLDQDILPRAVASRASRDATSASVYYILLLFGFLATLAAAGIELSKLTILVGALGVGIGFGLQNVIQNFVAGLILLFGRPIKAGDIIQVGDLVGETMTIGFRASTVRTWQGAEVIVPNANLISDQVINWTLSDQRRRIEIKIGVAYGTDPQRVLDLLLEVAASNPAVAQEPKPMALFLAHGESSLDFELRVWTAYDGWVLLHSELTHGINRALTAAGIEIPFPQRDLHVRSVDDSVREALARN